MKFSLLTVGLLASASLCAAQKPSSADVARWEREARAVTITRDDWGIAHVRGHTDADAVFGMIYAQAEDDFNRVENNYLLSIGRLAEAEGEKEIWRDLRQKLFIDPVDMKAKYAASPAWLKKLMNSWADGLNYYLYKHPEVKPRVIARFEPWMPLTFSEGSIGGDIERVNLDQLAAFYGGSKPASASGSGASGDGEWDYTEPSGSNGFAISPKNTADHHALLWINPHTSFYFRSELQMSSDEGLDAYGAVTWGQFFIYQGFNRTAGWMHTSSGVDNLDEFLETVSHQGDRISYRHGTKELPMRSRVIEVPYKTTSGMATRRFTVYYTQHGPVVRSIGDKWVSVSLMQDPMHALIQSYSRTKAKDYAAWKKIMALHTNSSNNTVFADAEGNIAYWHSNYIPRRDNSLDWTKPVDGSDPRTDYHGVLSVDETPGALNPASGFVFNVNDWPWNVAGEHTLDRAKFPIYVENGREESPRGYHALRVLPGKHDFTMTSLAAAAFDSYLPSFAHMLPALVKAYDSAPATDTLKKTVGEQMAALRDWDYRWSATSIPTSLAVYWGEEVERRAGRAARTAGALSAEDYVADGAPAGMLLGALAAASNKLAADFGTWKTPWGDINRFQRLDDAIDSHFDDAGPSIPVPFTSSRWGSLASFGARQYPNTKRWYGTSGNSFVAVVEFGDSVKARAVTAGGESGHPESKHFIDEAERYASGNLRDVYYWPSQLKGHTEREYHPGS